MNPGMEPDEKDQHHIIFLAALWAAFFLLVARTNEAVVNNLIKEDWGWKQEICVN